MPTFSFNGFDRSGTVQTGSVTAATANDAVRLLAARGVIVQNVSTAPDAIPQRLAAIPAAPPPAVSADTASRARTPAAKIEQGRTNVVAHVGGGSKVRAEPKATGFFKDYELFLLLSQLAQLLRSGVAPSEAFHHLAGRTSLKPKVREAMRRLSQSATEGRTLSEAMEEYPDIFPPGTVGAIRAGETGGYTWQACQYVSEQTQNTWKLRRLNSWFAFAFWTTVAGFPLVPVVNKGWERLANTVNENNVGVDRTFAALREGLVQGFLGLGGVLFVLCFAVWLLLPYITGRRKFLPLRHALAAKLPIIGRRTRMENVGAFGFHLENLSSAGISPYQSWSLAVDAVPNVEIARQMRAGSTNQHDSQALSKSMSRASLFPVEYTNLVQTAEMTGSVPETMRQIQSLAESDRKSMETILKVKLVIWSLILTLGVSVVATALMYRGLLDAAWKAIFEGT